LPTASDFPLRTKLESGAVNAPSGPTAGFATGPPEAGLPNMDRDGSGALLAAGSLCFLTRYAEDPAPPLCVRYR